MKTSFIYTVFTLVILISCKPEVTSVSEADITAESQKANAYFDKVFQDEVDNSPMLQTQLGIKKDYGKWDDMSANADLQDLQNAKTRLAYITDSISVEKLNADTKLSYTLFKQNLEQTIEDYQFTLYNYPVNQMHGAHAEIPAFLINMHRIDNVEDAQAYISRLQGLQQVFEDVSKGLLLREENGIMPPTFVFEKVIEDSKNLLKGQPFENNKNQSTLLEDFLTKIKDLDITEDTAQQLKTDAEQALINNLKPAFTTLITTL